MLNNITFYKYKRFLTLRTNYYSIIKQMFNVRLECLIILFIFIRKTKKI